MFAANPRLVFKYADHDLPGIVDGMTIDTEGNLWVANFDGNHVSWTTNYIQQINKQIVWCVPVGFVVCKA